MINDNLKQIFKQIYGNIIIIGNHDDKLIKLIETNDKITKCSILTSVSKNKDKSKGRSKTIYIRQFRKKFKKKKNDYMIIDIKEVEKYLKHFIKDSVYINRNIIYLYGKINKDTLDQLIKKYNRYNVKIDCIKNTKSFFLTINCKKAKTNKFKDLWYLIYDTISELFLVFEEILLK